MDQSVDSSGELHNENDTEEKYDANENDTEEKYDASEKSENDFHADGKSLQSDGGSASADDGKNEEDSREEPIVAEDDCESKKTLSDENSIEALRGKGVQFSRGSTPDSDTLTQQSRIPSSSTKDSKYGLKVAGSTERGAACPEGSIETPSGSWAFSARASIAPSKFDHMATLKMNYSARKQSNEGREGVPLSLM